MLRSASTPLRIGLVVPSSNTTMETEIPALLARQARAAGGGFTFHSARLRLRQVTPLALAAMNEGAADAADALCDADVDVLVYACLVAAMFGGRAAMEAVERRIRQGAAASMRSPSVVTSAGALVAALQSLGARRIALVAPYRRELTAKVAATIGEHGIEVGAMRSLEIADNLAVGRIDARRLITQASELDLAGVDALVLSACVQMPSLDVLEEAEQRFGLPVVSAATATTWALLRALAVEPAIDGAGSLLRSAASPRLQEAA